MEAVSLGFCVVSFILGQVACNTAKATLKSLDKDGDGEISSEEMDALEGEDAVKIGLGIAGNMLRMASGGVVVFMGLWVGIRSLLG
ncbi:MAG: hypothetical protein QGG40_01185 [Myxococcota bacterium]|jgi:hypothetical protein|nr:hypothetical protein [Myxococcota bacterium]